MFDGNILFIYDMPGNRNSCFKEIPCNDGRQNTITIGRTNVFKSEYNIQFG